MNVSKDPDARTVEWRFSDIDLPPNETPPEGEGFVEFTAELRGDVPSGTTVAETNGSSFTFQGEPGTT